ncbi:MAG: hypothetical protein JWM10_4113 [Myxococcaceae bacterium]|nr:hypothetical protein [Myxococcaceae bacterium]
MVGFDEVLPTVLRVCEGSPAFSGIARICVVRDLRGRVRLAVRPVSGSAPDLAALAEELRRELGPWFVEEVFSTADKDDRRHIAAKALELSKPWDDARYLDFTGGERVATAKRWCLVERRLTKESWFETSSVSPPWNLADSTPAIVTFYSFKGGVGRTTALVSCALQAAEEGPVVVLDLDLEAPGLGALLDVRTERGVLDCIVEHAATGSLDLERVHGAPRAIVVEGAEPITVLPAGNLDALFLEKLARLDLLNRDLGAESAASTTQEALRALLHEVRKRWSPKYIFLDARAGLHDLAGLSLHGLSHVDVLVSRATEQGYQGLHLTVETLGRRRRAERAAPGKQASDRQCMVVQSFGALDEQVAAAETERFRERSYESFAAHYYVEETDPVASDAPHFPVVIKRHEELERDVPLREVEAVLRGADYQRLWARLQELCIPTRRAP